MDKEARGYLVARLVSKEINLGVPFPFHNSLLTAQFLLFDMGKERASFTVFGAKQDRLKC